MSSFDDGQNPSLESRLRALGEQPIDPATRSAHLTAIGSLRPAGHGLRDKLKVAAALAGGFLLGSTGLAFAGALPTPAQDAASEALARVGVEVPVGTDRYFGEECVAGTDGSHARNRGLYLKQERAKGADALAAAKDSDCGMPVVSLNGDDTDEREADSDATPPKCVDGAKVTGKSQGKGRSDAAPKSTTHCETLESDGSSEGAPPAGAIESGEDAPGRGSAPDRAGRPEDPGRSTAPGAAETPPAAEGTPPATEGTPPVDVPARGDDDAVPDDD